QRRFRRGLTTDITWFFWDPLVNRPVTVFTVAVFAVLVAVIAGAGMSGSAIRAWLDRETIFNSQPPWLQAIQLIVLVDLIGYWSHRFFHEVGVLWRIHAVHHSSETLDWLSSVRVHPLNEIGQRMAQALPFLLLGYSPGLLAAVVPLLTLYAIGLHANVSWDFGPLRKVIASPRFHRWHHTSELEGLDKNYSGLLPVWDILFRTYYMPVGRVPAEFGVLGETVPEGLFRQLLYPLRRRPSAAVRG
ncbi:MAG: sterol desaturase family protein, partial [Dehalococcoidia bacterium]|nr:sterol desaturase family protein [Dehalococcoidia bacterium]